MEAEQSELPAWRNRKGVANSSEGAEKAFEASSQRCRFRQED